MPGKGKVLVIDDNPDAVEVLRNTLTDNGYDVVSTLSGEDGLKMALSEHPNCVLLDVMMPGISGFNICKTLKRDMGLSLPVVILSAKSGAKDISYAKSMGADDYLTKPVSARRLLTAVDAAVSAGAHHGTMAGTTLDTVLIVSHNVKTVYQLRQFVEDLSSRDIHRHRVLQAESCPQAERLSKSETIDLVIIDCTLPGDAGSKLCRSLKTDLKRKSIPIIALLGKAEDDIKYAWADDRLTQPINTAALLAAVKRHLKLS